MLERVCPSSPCRNQVTQVEEGIKTAEEITRLIQDTEESIKDIKSLCEAGTFYNHIKHLEGELANLKKELAEAKKDEKVSEQ